MEQIIISIFCRLSTIQAADRIVVMEGGQIVEVFNMKQPARYKIYIYEHSMFLFNFFFLNPDGQPFGASPERRLILTFNQKTG